MSLLTVTGISKEDSRGFALKEISFTQEASQKIAIAGETGSGKSTLLKIIAGMVQPGAGTVLYNGVRVKGPNDQLIPGHPRIAYLSQHYELRNNYRVAELMDMASKIPAKAADTVYEVCRITHLLRRWTNELSGGEKQRISLARLLLTSPGMLVLDEPFSNLDLIHKTILKAVIEDAIKQLSLACLLASHDPQDTLSWADKILVLKDGKLVQQGAPKQLYYHPANEYVAGLFGKYCLLPAAIFYELTGIKSECEHLFIRPESFRIAPAAGNGAIPGIITNVTFWGSYYDVEAALLNTTITVRTFDGNHAVGNSVFIALNTDGGAII